MSNQKNEHKHCHGDSCACGHNHGEEHEHSHCGCGCNHERGRTKLIARIIVSAVLLVGAVILRYAIKLDGIIPIIICAASYIVIGYDVVMKSVSNLFKGKIFDENLLMTIASIGAFLIGEHPEGAAVMLLYQLGEVLQDRAVDKSERSIESLLDVRAEYANIEKDGRLVSVAPEQVNIGDIFVVKNGEKVPLDGVVCEGDTFVDTSALTGESVPVRVTAGSEVMGGTVNNGGLIKVRAVKTYSDSAVSKILEFVTDARAKKPVTEKFISRFAKRYTPIVVFLALAVMLVVPLFDGMNFAKWVERGLVFLVVSCPCALVISVPLGFFAAMGAASKHGVLIKGGEYVEKLSRLDTAVFDKTGTLTEGVFKVTGITGDTDRVRECAAYAEYYSNHPLAKAIIEECGGEISPERLSEYNELPGLGVSAKLDESQILVGNYRLMSKFNVPCEEGMQIYVAEDGVLIGSITVDDELKEDAEKAVKAFKTIGVKTVMLTGDRREAAEKTAAALGIDEFKSGLLPHQKSEEFLKLDGVKLFCGDGINDAPVIAVADVGFAMGGMGSDSAVETADAVILTDEPSKTSDVVKLSKRSMAVIKQNIVFSIAIKVIVMILGMLNVPGIMWFAIFADVGVSMAAVANSMRIMRF